MTDLTHPHTAVFPRGPVRRAAWHGGLFLTLLLPVAVGLTYLLADIAGAPNPELAAGLTAVIFMAGAVSAVAGLRNRQSYPHGRLGLCNLVTLLRGTGIAMMAGLVLAPASGLGWGLVVMAGVLLALDGIDGWAARRARLESRFGARLDVETDVAFAITLAALAVAMGQVGAWFLLIGLLRPLFLAAGWLWPALRAPLPDARWRKIMAGLQMAVQVGLIAPVLPAGAATVLGATMLSAMVLSFGIDIRWLLRRSAIA